MSIISYKTIKNMLFKLEPETAHTIAGFGLKTLSTIKSLKEYYKNEYFNSNPILKQNILGMEFANPVGLGAGFDKNGDYIDSIISLGFGYIEVGTVTPKPQKGNDKPRLFRLVEDESIQNAMGFNNKGSDYLIENMKQNIKEYPVGINIGKNKLTAEDKALDDYEFLLKELESYSDYIVINISSPNTPGLRDLQNEEFITSLFTMAKDITTKPIFLKIAPDMTSRDAINLCGVAIKAGASGIIATNTTIDYSLTPNAKDFGGISGKLLKEKSFELFNDIAKEYYGKTILISVGGIDSPEEAYRRIKAGASLIQVFSMLIYRGPQLIKDINDGLVKLIQEDGYENISQAIGVDREND